MNEQLKEKFRQNSRERYTFVKTFDYRLYENICAFASTVDLTRDNARSKIEDFCMSIVMQAAQDGGK